METSMRDVNWNMWITVTLIAFLVSVAVSRPFAAANASTAPAAAAAAADAPGLAIDAVRFANGMMHLHLANSGAGPVSVGLVSVNDAYAGYTMAGSHTLAAGGSADVTVPYNWVTGDAYSIGIFESDGTLVATDATGGEDSAA